MKKKITAILALIMSTTLIFAGCAAGEEPAPPAAEPVTISVSAAASLTDALGEIATEYAKECKDEILFNFAGSGSLKTQILEGAPCDLFISASKDHMDAVAEQGLIEEDTRMDLLKNTLTLIAAKEAAEAVTMDTIGTDKVESIALGEAETVPAGKYGMQALESAGVWDAVQPKIVFAKDVKAVLDYVDTGNADCGFVYKTDAMLLKTGVVIEDLPEDSHDPIVYPAAVIANSEQKDAALAFYEFIKGDQAKAIFEKYGFTMV